MLFSGIISLITQNGTLSPQKHHTFVCGEVSSTRVKVMSGAWWLFWWRYCLPSQSPLPKWKGCSLLMNCVKTETRATLSESTLNNLVTIRAGLRSYSSHQIMAINCSPPTKSENTEEIQKPRCCKKVKGFNRQFFN